MPNSLSLAGLATTGHLDFDIVFAQGIGSLEGLFDSAAVFNAREKLLIELAVDNNLPAASREQLHLRYGAFALACSMVISLSSH